ncbi:MAG: cytochrome c3 family protein [Kiritimatiellota bacterium]|nr:cytochrome c3 family protein [Kiritimatiellota bacterium]
MSTPRSSSVWIRFVLRTRRFKSAWLKGTLFVASLSAMALIAAMVVSCTSLNNRTVQVAPGSPGAKAVGTETCATCHEKTVNDFKTATHARLKAEGDNALDVGCESCHGGGSVHVEAGGSRGTMINPKKSPEMCFQCHLDKRGEFSLPHTHPVLAGKLGGPPPRMSCSDCHDPHKGDAVKAGGTALESRNETCFKCHAAQRGPFVREHAALREGCTTCHAVHGSVNDKMLVSRNANLCLSCHMQRQTKSGTITIGSRDHASFLPRGTCWSAGCHQAVHGSQVSEKLRF